MEFRFTRNQVNITVKVVLGTIFFITGLTYSNTTYFQEYPLFGVPFLAEFAIALVFGAFGFYLVPRYIQILKNWIEDLVIRTTYRLVSDFWTEYTARMESNKKQRLKEEESKKRHKRIV